MPTLDATDARFLWDYEMDTDETDINDMILPPLSEEERAAMNALGSDFIQRLLAGERPLPVPREKPPTQGPAR